MSTWMSETGSYTTSPPGGTPLTPTPDNPGGYATFNETRDDLATVTNSATVVWMATATNSGTSESANMTYNGNAASNYTSHKVTAADAGTPAGSESGSYTATGGKGERSHIHREGGWGGSNYGGSYVFDDMLINGKGLIDTGFYPQGGGRQETSTVTTGGSETNTWWIHSPGTNWSRSHTSTTPFTTSNYENSAPDNLAKQPADAGPAPPQEAEDGSATGGAKPWYDDGDWYDAVNPAAWLAKAWYDGKEFVTRNHGAEWDSLYRNGDKAVWDYVDGRTDSFRSAWGKGVAKQARTTLDDAAKWTNSYTTGLQLVTMAPGLYRAGVSAVEGSVNSSLVQCQLLQKACFAAGTPLHAPTNSQRIETFLRNGGIPTRDENDPAADVRLGMVDDVFQLTAQIWELHIGGRVIETTAEHPFYLVGPGHVGPLGWTPLCRLKPGDLLLGRGPVPTAVERVVQTNRTATVYNLRVEPDHTFFVGGDDWGFSLWVHNTPCRFAVQEALENGVINRVGRKAAGVLTQAELNQKHHIFPQAFKSWFKRRGITVDDWVIILDKTTHEALHAGGGPGRGGGWWNGMIMGQLRAVEKQLGRLNAAQIEAVGRKPVYRGGSDFTLKPGEFRLDGNGLVKGTHGLSLNTDPRRLTQFPGGPRRILSVPDELQIIQRGTKAPFTHFEIVPKKLMRLEQFQSLFDLFHPQ